MKPCRLPEPKAAFADKPFSAQLLGRACEQIFRLARPFTGFLKVSAPSGSCSYLFFLRSEPYASGKFANNRPFATTIAEFFAGVHAGKAEQLSLSLFETDPVLLKSMLVWLQETATIKAPANLIPLAEILREIFAEKEDALIVLENAGMCNFFFVRQGIGAPPHLADRSWSPPENLVNQEAILDYVGNTVSPPMVHIYRSTTTERAADAGETDRQKLLAMASGAAAS